MNKAIVPILLFIVYLTIGIFTITHYGINWDEPAHFMRGQTFLRFFLTGKKDYSDLPQIDNKSYKKDYGYEFVDNSSGSIVRRSIYQYSKREFAFYTQDIEKNGTHPVFSDVMSALFNYVFFIKLGIAPDIFSYNYYVVFVAALLVAGMYVWVKKNFGHFAAIISSLSLALFPVFWAESHNNVKDIPQAVFFSFALFSFYEAVTTKKIKYVLLFALFGSFAFATKFNFIFVAPIIIFWLIFRWLFIYRTKLQNFPSFFNAHKLFVLSFLAVPFIVILVWIGTFPAMWFEPKLILASISYYKTVGTSALQGFNPYVLNYLAFATPPAILAYAFIGATGFLLSFKKREKDLILLVSIWFLVSVGRVMIPGTVIYGGVRQIMEYIPALAILSGIGAGVIATWLHSFVVKNKLLNHLAIKPLILLQLLITLSFLPITFKLISLHPNEGVYFNFLIGGLKGAKEHDIADWGQTLGNPHRQGIKWINDHAEKEARLSLSFELWSNVPHIWVRNDIIYDEKVKSGPARQGEYVMSVTNKSGFLDWYTAKYYETFIQPIYKLEVDDVSLLKIWKNDNTHIKNRFKNLKEEKILSVDITRQNNSFTLTLPSAKRLLRIELHNENPNVCKRRNQYVGNIQLYRGNSFSEPVALRGSVNDFKDKLTYKEPFFLFNGEKAKVVVLNIAVDDPCFTAIKSADVYVIKE